MLTLSMTMADAIEAVKLIGAKIMETMKGLDKPATQKKVTG